MEFGIALGGGDAGGGGAGLSGLLERAERLDTAGSIHRLWVADERFQHDPWVVLGALAAVTRRVSLGTTVTDPFIRHPALTALAAATLDEASGGRAILGLGAGASGFRALGIERTAPATALREMILLARLLWGSSTPVSFEGKTTFFRNDRLQLPILRQIPIYVAGRGPSVLEVAGELADGAMIGTFVGGPLLDYALARVAAGEARRDAALPRLRRISWAYLAIDDDREAARHAVREGIATALWGSRPVLSAIGIGLPRPLSELMDSVAYSSDPAVIGRAAALVPEELVDDCSIAGSAAQCIAKIRALAGRGFDEIAVWPFPTPAVPVDVLIDRFAREVAPAVRAG